MTTKDHESLWANNLQSLCQLLRGSMPGSMNGYMAEANILKQLNKVKFNVNVGGRDLAVRFVVRSIESAPADAYIVIIDPERVDDDVPGADASAYEVWRWASKNPTGVRWIAIDVKFCSIGAGATPSEMEVEFYRWGRGSKTRIPRTDPNYEAVVLVVEGVVDAAGFMPTQSYARMTDQSIGVEALFTRVPHFANLFMIDTEDFEAMLERVVRCSITPGSWFVNPSNDVEYEGWQPKTIDQPQFEAEGAQVAYKTSMTGMIRLFDAIERTDTAYRIRLKPIAPLFGDFDLCKGNGNVVHVDFKADLSRSVQLNFLQKGQHWDFVISPANEGRYICLARHEIAPYIGKKSLKKAFITAHTFGMAAMLRYIDENAADVTSAREQALRDATPDDVCSRDVWVLNPNDIGDPKEGRKRARIMLPWVPTELVASCVAIRYGVPFCLGRGDPSGACIVVHYHWSDEDLAKYQSTGRMPFDLWNVKKRVPGARCIVLKLLDLASPPNRNPMPNPFSIFRRDWRRPIEGPGRYFLIVGGIMDEQVHKTGSLNSSRYMLLPSEFTALSSGNDTLKKPNLQKKATGEHYARRQKASMCELQDPKWGGQAATVSFGNGKVPVINPDLGIDPARYVLGLADGSLMAVVKDILETPEGETSINHPLFPSGNKPFARANYHRSVRDVLEAKWDYGYERQWNRAEEAADSSEDENGRGLKGAGKRGRGTRGVAKGGDAKGNAAKGDAAKGDAAKGNTKGNTTKGNTTKGNTTKGNAAKGNAAKDNAAKDNAAKGNARRNKHVIADSDDEMED